MDGGRTTDLELFGVAAWPAVYDGLAERRDAFADSAATVLDTKAQSPCDPFLDMQAMLVEMTKELRERFQRFQSQRLAAEEDAAEAGDEAARKLAQTDAKAAIEAVSLIVRTLEKIDSLQRTLIHERAEAEAAAGEEEDEDALAAEFDRLVAERAEEIARRRIEEWKAEIGAGGPAGDAGAGVGGFESGP